MTEFAHNAITPSGSSRAISGSCSRPAPCVERRRGGRIALKEPYPHHIEIADGDPHLQAAVSQLVRTMYSARGLHVPIEQTTTPVASPRTTTLVARAGEKVLGTVTVGADARSGLLADERYRAEVDRIRMHSIGLCEFTRLAIDPLFSSPRILANMFNVAFVLARHLHRAASASRQRPSNGSQPAPCRLLSPHARMHGCRRRNDLPTRRRTGDIAALVTRARAKSDRATPCRHSQ